MGVLWGIMYGVRMGSEQSNPIQYTLKMGCSGSSVHIQYTVEYTQLMQLPPSSREQHGG